MDKHQFSARRRIWGGTMRGLMLLCAAVTCALAVFLIVYVLVKGVPNLSWQLLSTKPSYLDGSIGILPDIVTTVCTVLTTLLVVLPLGVCAAVYLTEYAANKRVVAVIEYAAETLSGIPSIIYGLVGQMFFCQFLGMKKSLLAGAMTLVIMNLPTIMRTTQESLKTVPQSYREGAFGLGAGKWRTIRTVVLPGCVDGVLTGCIRPWAVSWARRQHCCTPRALPTRCTTACVPRWRAPAPHCPWPCMSTPRSRASSMWPSPSPPSSWRWPCSSTWRLC